MTRVWSEEAGIDDHRLAECPANDLNKRSIIKKSMTAAVDKYVILQYCEMTLFGVQAW